MRLTFVAVATAVGAVACATTPKAEGGDVEIYTYEPEIGTQSMRQVELLLPWEITNPGPAGVTVDALTWRLLVNDHQIDEKRVELAQGVTAGATATGKVNARIELSTTDEAFAAREANPTLRWQVVASFAIGGGPDGLVEYEADWDGELLGPRRPTVTATGQAARSDSGSVEVNFVVTIANSNAFPIDIEGLDFELFIEDERVEGGRLAAGQQLDGANELQFDVGATVTSKSHKKLVQTLLESDAMAYRIESTLAAEGLKMATPVSGELSFPK